MAITLVTGATGFVGRRVLRRLLDGDDEVRVLVRDPARLDPGAAARAEIVRGDLSDRWAIARAVERADTVLHLAALAKPHARHPGAFAAVNTAAVQQLLRAAAQAGVRRFVHVSTWLVPPPDRPAPLRGAAAAPTPYETSKRQAETVVRAFAANGLHAVIVRPTRVYGPGPLHEANGATKLLALYLAGRLRIRLADGDALANWVHVDDVAAGVLLAARHGRRGAAYLLGGPEDASLREYLELAAQVAGVRPRRMLALPPRAGVLLARLSMVLGGLGRLPVLTPGWIRTFLESRTTDIGPACRDLGYAPRSLREGLTETVAWLNGGDPRW